MKDIFLKQFVFVLAVVFPALVFADTASKVNSWFNNMNYANVTMPGVYEGQSARFITPGGLSMRAPVTQPFHFFDVQTPKFSAGCGGIDFYAGGFSAIDTDQFVENLRAIGQNAQSLAFMLAIRVVSPQLSSVMEEIQTWANKFNSMNISSCEAAGQLMEGALGDFMSEEANCVLMRVSQNGEDYNTAQYNCKNGGKRKETVDADGTKDVLDFMRGNLAWHVLMQDPFFQADPDFAEVVMNITGTLILKDAPGGSDSGIEPTYLAPAIVLDVKKERFENIYAALLYGNKATEKLKIWQCDGGAVANNDGCNSLDPDVQEITPNWVGLYTRVEDLMQSIMQKIESDTALTLEEKGLIASTSIPVYRFIAAATTYFPKGTNLSTISNEYTTLIAHDILLRSLSAIIQKVEQRSLMLKKGMAEAPRISAFREDLEKVMQGLANLRKKNEYTAAQLVSMQEQILKYEKALLPSIGGKIVEASLWGGN